MRTSIDLKRHAGQSLKAILRLLWKLLLLILWGAFSVIEVVAKGFKEAIERIKR
jgi:hypothetical protein